jgi:AraC family transcriptional regulator
VLFVDLRLTKDASSSMVRFLEGLGHDVVFSGRAEALRAAAAGLRGALALAGPRRTARVQSVLWDMLAEMTAKREAPPAPAQPRRKRLKDDPKPEDLRLQIADSLMRDAVAQPPTVDALAAAAGLSRSQLTRLYKKHHGLGPAERLRQLRIDKARELLTATTLSVKEVAHVCGFVCPNHFCRVFLQLAGVTPSGWRRKLGGDD